jgi:adenylate cyclase
LTRPDDALRANEEALRLEPNSYDVQYWFGRTCLVLGRHQDALAHYERAAELLETDYFSLSLAAGIYHALGREDECRSTAARSLERLEREIAVHPDNANALALGATDLAYVGEFERAEEWGLRSMTIDPDDPMNVYNVACTMAQMNKIDRALELLEACVGKMAAIRIERVKRDYDLVPLHNHPRYQALIAAGETRLAAVQAEEAAKVE